MRPKRKPPKAKRTKPTVREVAKPSVARGQELAKVRRKPRSPQLARKTRGGKRHETKRWEATKTR